MAKRLERERDDEYEPGNNFYADDSDDFECLYANLPVSTHTHNNNCLPPPVVSSHEMQPLALLMTREEENRKIADFIRKSDADWQRYLKTEIKLEQGEERSEDHFETDRLQKRPHAGYICHRCGVTEEHYIQNCPTNGDPAFDNFTNTSRWERNAFPMRTNIVSQPDDSAEVKAKAKDISGSPSTLIVVPASTSSPVQDAFDQPVSQFEETQQQIKTRNYVQTNVSAGRRQNGFIGTKPFPGYVCHRCLTPDDHYILDCPTKGNPAYYILDCPTKGNPAYYNFSRPPAKSFNVRPSFPTLNYEVTTSVVPKTLPVYNQTRLLFNYNVAQGYPNQGFPPV